MQYHAPDKHKKGTNVMMKRYNVEAQADYSTGSGGKILVYVTDEQGQSVTGLTQENFKIDWNTPDLGGDKTYLTYPGETYSPGHPPGLYILLPDLIGVFGKTGTFSFVVRVKRNLVSQKGGEQNFAAGLGLATLVKLV